MPESLARKISLSFIPIILTLSFIPIIFAEGHYE